jgi:hypothetical protein
LELELWTKGFKMVLMGGGLAGLVGWTAFIPLITTYAQLLLGSFVLEIRVIVDALASFMAPSLLRFAYSEVGIRERRHWTVVGASIG